MCAVVRRIFSGDKLAENKITTINAILPEDKYKFLKGIVYSPDDKPLPNSAIEIVQINNNVKPAIIKKLGVIFTLEDGSYGVSLLWEKGYSYKLSAYSPVKCI